MEALLNEIITEETSVDNGFVIDDDTKAEWALRKIRLRNAERDRIVHASMDTIAEYNRIIAEEQKRAQAENAYLESLLRRYFDGVEHKATKTQETYRLPTGKLIMKLGTVKMVPNREALQTECPDFVETKKDIRWADLKKLLQVTDAGVVRTDTGESIIGVSIEEVPAEFKVEA